MILRLPLLTFLFLRPRPRPTFRPAPPRTFQTRRSRLSLPKKPAKCDQPVARCFLPVTPTTETRKREKSVPGAGQKDPCVSLHASEEIAVDETAFARARFDQLFQSTDRTSLTCYLGFALPADACGPGSGSCEICWVNL